MEVDFQRQSFQVITAIKPEHMPFGIVKIRLLVLRLRAKSLFPSEPEVDFQRQQFSVITFIKLNICRLNFENPSISSQDMSKKHFPV